MDQETILRFGGDCNRGDSSNDVDGHHELGTVCWDSSSIVQADAKNKSAFSSSGCMRVCGARRIR
jgi:hypothetical protein